MSLRPPRRWTCRCGTDSPPSGPLLMAILNPLSRLSFLARALAVRRRCPRVAWSSVCASLILGIGFFGMTRRCVGACGSMS